MHPWIGAGDEDRRRILTELGLESIDELFSSIPAEVCVDRLPMDDGRDENSVRSELQSMALANLSPECVPSFLGAGVYRHVSPSVVDSVLSRAEFFTSYTPYQPEISQGTLQVIFEFQTLICQLTGMEVSNASLYDGATALVEAVLFAHRVKRGKLDRVVLAETLHPMYRKVLATYADPAGLEVVVVPPGDDGRVSADALREAAGESSCCIAVQSPNFLGIVEDLPAVAEAARDTGTLAVQVVTEGVSLGLLSGGGAHGFDVVCGEAQSFGLRPRLRRTPPRFLRLPGEGHPPDARQTRRGDHRQHRPTRLLPDPLDPRAAHPSRQGDLEHLHQPGPHGAGGDDLARGHRRPRTQGARHVVSLPNRGAQATHQRDERTVEARLSNRLRPSTSFSSPDPAAAMNSPVGSPPRACSPGSPPIDGAVPGPTGSWSRSPNETPLRIWKRSSPRWKWSHEAPGHPR